MNIENDMAEEHSLKLVSSESHDCEKESGSAQTTVPNISAEKAVDAGHEELDELLNGLENPELLPIRRLFDMC